MIDLPNTVTIKTADYLALIRSDLELTELENAGVDNWEGYGELDWDAISAGVDAAKAKLLDEEQATELTLVQRYAIDLIADGAESCAEDDIDEEGAFPLHSLDHTVACDLALAMVRGIKANPRAVLALAVPAGAVAE